MASDCELLSAYARERSEAAFEELVRRHGQMVYAAALRILGDAQLAEDAAQAVFLVLAKRAASLLRREHLAGWLCLAACNAARNLTRERCRRAVYERRSNEMRATETDAAPADNAEHHARHREVLAHLDEALAGLSGAHRAPIAMRWLEGRSLEDVAGELRCSPKAAGMRLRRALEALRKRLRRRGVDAEANLLVGVLLTQSGAELSASLGASMNAAATAAQGAAFSATAQQTAEALMQQYFWTQVAGWTFKGSAAAALALCAAGAWSASNAQAMSGDGGGVAPPAPPQIGQEEQEKVAPLGGEVKEKKDGPDGGKPAGDAAAATARALDYLARLQDKDGSWSDSQYPNNTGVTALAAIALMGDGSRPGKGAHGEALKKAVDFILSQQQASGVFAAKSGNPYGPMYEHCYATLFLSLARKDAVDPNAVGKALSKAVLLIAKCQKLDGGWRYQMSREGHSDLSVTGNVLWVLSEAKRHWDVGDDGLDQAVSVKCLEMGKEFVEKCAQPDGKFRYRFWGQELNGMDAASMNGLGTLAVYSVSGPGHPLAKIACERIGEAFERAKTEDAKAAPWFSYATFYASLAMYREAPQQWDAWYRRAAALLVATQDEKGRMDTKSGEIHPTAMAAIVLQAPLGHLGIYHRENPKESPERP
ncbi:MAG: sigma-70 family RNA polymerase sigma factor [Planctomycetes bacterium]|nr:sigma-70 family RNA polymerase sigma factor [Planctomycetota bacterium]